MRLLRSFGTGEKFLRHNCISYSVLVPKQKNGGSDSAVFCVSGCLLSLEAKAQFGTVATVITGFIRFDCNVQQSQVEINPSVKLVLGKIDTG